MEEEHKPRPPDDDHASGQPDAQAEYDKTYFDYYGGTPYVRSEHWLQFFNGVADRIVRDIEPKTVLDAGCAKGFLVDALRERGVEAYGFDISDYALAEVRADVKPYVWKASILEPLPRGFDLTVCIEVLEHLPEEHAAQAVANLTRTSDDILFASTPEDFEEVTHKNVQPLEYWAALFAERGFYRDLEFDALFIAWHAVRFRKRREPAHRLIIPYERRFSRQEREIHSLRQLAGRNRAQIAELEDEKEALIKEVERQSTTQAQLESSENALPDLQSKLEALVEENSELRDKLRRTQDEVRALEKQAEKARSDHDQILREWGTLNKTLSWRAVQLWWRWRERLLPRGTTRRRFLSWIRSVLVGLVRSLSRSSHSGPDPRPTPKTAKSEAAATDYERWIRHNEPTPEALDRQTEAARTLGSRPLISIITPVYNPVPDHLEEAVRSVLEQTYDHWELCLVDASDTGHPASVVAERLAGQDERIRLRRLSENRGISGNSNEALAMAQGSYVAFLDHDDTLAPFALYRVVERLNENPGTGMLYSDHDILLEGDRRSSPLFKPSWSPEIMLSANYITHLTVVRRELVENVGGFDPEMDGAQDWDLFLKVSEMTEAIEHIPEVLYHWRDAPGSTAEDIHEKTYAPRAQLKAIEAHLRRLGRQATVDFAETGFLRATWPTRNESRVSIIIPTRDQLALLKKCITSIFDHTRYEDFEILLVDTGSVEEATFEYYDKLEGDDRVSIHSFDQPFNYSQVNNFGARRAAGDLLLFLNNDVEALEEGWLEELVRWSEVEAVGVVGAKLLYPDRTIQHAGVVIGLDGYAGHIFAGAREGRQTPFGFPEWYRNYTAVTAACMMLRRDVFEEIGGFDESFQLNGSDVELCLRARRSGRRVVYTPFARLLHHEGMTHGGVTPEEDYFTSLRHYEEILRSGDPYYSPNLSLAHTVPRIKRPGEPPATEFVERHLQQLAGDGRQDSSSGEPPSPPPVHWQSRVATLVSRSARLARRLAKSVVKDGDLWDRYSEDAISLANWFDFSEKELERSKRVQEENAEFRDIRSISWFLPEFEHAYFGGIHTILRFAAHLHSAHGVQNRFVVFGRMSPDEVSEAVAGPFPELGDQPTNVIQSIDAVRALPEADVAIASLWSTAYAVLKYNQTRRKFYFIQDFEPLFYPAGSTYAQAEATYQFGFFGITNTSPLKRIYQGDYGGVAESFLPAVDTDVFYPQDSQTSNDDPYKVFFYGRPRHPRNGFELGAQALRKVKEEYGKRVQIISAGDEWDPKDYGVEGVVENLGLLGYEETGAVYRDCDVGLVMMFTRHPSYLPLEMMASGCLVVTNFNPNTTWLLEDGGNCLLTLPSATALAETISEGLQDKKMRARITENALKLIRDEFADWQGEIDKIYRFMRDPWNADR